MDEDRSRDVAADHTLHWLAMLAAAGYAWRLHGFWIGIAVMLGLLAVIAVTNMIILVKSGNLGLIRVNRWGWVFLASSALVWSSASGGTA